MMIAKIVAIFTLVGLCYGGFHFFDCWVAKSTELRAAEASIQSLSTRLDLKIEGDRLSTTQGRLWALEDRYGSNPDQVSDPNIKMQMKELKSQIPILEDKVKRLSK